MLHPAPGLITAYDEHACLVVDTRHDEWIHFTGPQAWAWETVHVTGSPESLDDLERGCVSGFVHCGLLVESNDEEPPVVLPVPSPAAEESGKCADPERSSSAVRPTALRLARKPLNQTMRLIQELHSQELPWADPESAHALYDCAQRRPAWLPERMHALRAVALTAVLAAHHAGLRLDWVLAYCHADDTPREWCRTPEAAPGFVPDCLEVHAV